MPLAVLLLALVPAAGRGRRLLIRIAANGLSQLHDLCHGVRIRENAIEFVVKFRHGQPCLSLLLHCLVDALNQRRAFRTLHHPVDHVC